MTVQLDLMHRGIQQPQLDRGFADPQDAAGERRSLADLVSPLIIEADGTVVPFGYGFARRYALGNLHDASFCALAADWRSHGYAEFRSLCRRVYESSSSARASPNFNWYEAIGEGAFDAPAAARGERRQGAHR
jgi:hypothetical protein